ncbi:galactokinase [Herbinix hemicellulosilytica]|uniref:Galactokinase n=1 Tax=Herbinix hemicellulosilytica TaxID=1564487 RepID=A0A0H5SHS6_HERHM|nr:galactokinase [Herbinix hemicellulosilytica]RBP60935.1 galactokinase [Herbinix hemicellulosilytica]CRZ34630.1 Galactokinase [Herbinix hemicellulosilytica]
MKDKLLKWFKDVYNYNDGVQVYFAPGRVNLIGEHTDYNGGHVFPCALEIGTYGAARLRSDRIFRFYSMNFPEKGIIYSSLDEILSAGVLSSNRKNAWADYPIGVLWAFARHSFMPKIDRGMDILFFGDIPNGSGLSSSASIEVLMAYIAKDLYDIDISLKDISLLTQYAENKYVGVNCGIMDQFAVAMGKKDHAIFLNTSTLEYEYAPLNLKNKKIIIANSNKKRGLNESKYNERRSECEEALRRLQTVINIKTLGDLSREEFETHKDVIKEETLIRRAKHAVYENQRTKEAFEALKKDDIKKFGLLMKESHISLRDDYEVTGLNLDTLFEAAILQDGVIGARMTGAGFGGCTVNIVDEECVGAFMENVGRIYEEKTGMKADFYAVKSGDGPYRL